MNQSWDRRIRRDKIQDSKRK